MITKLRLEVTDEQREKIARSLGCPLKMVGRKDIVIAVEKYIDNLITGCSDEADRFANEDAEGPPPLITEAERDRSVREFVPSRGDEPYLYNGKDPELTAACRSVLDGLEFLDGYTWAALERNRE